jgi:alpha-L-fucosidase
MGRYDFFIVVWPPSRILTMFLQDFLYDHFIPRLGGKFNASAIMGLVAGSGARYFVPTTMHHDGFAIFDTLNATKRSSVYLGPKRDFLDELFEAAKAEQPHIHRGTYVTYIFLYIRSSLTPHLCLN